MMHQRVIPKNLPEIRPRKVLERTDESCGATVKDLHQACAVGRAGWRPNIPDETRVTPTPDSILAIKYAPARRPKARPPHLGLTRFAALWRICGHELNRAHRNSRRLRTGPSSLRGRLGCTEDPRPGGAPLAADKGPDRSSRRDSLLRCEKPNHLRNDPSLLTPPFVLVRYISTTLAGSAGQTRRASIA